MKYRNSNHLRLSIILFIFVLIILIVLLCINHKDILRNDRRYSFQEAFQKQTQSNQLNTIDKNNQFVLANNNEVKRAMSISKKDNDLKYMDLSKTVPMNEDEVKHILKNKGILTDQAQTFLKAQDKYHVNIIYLMNHAIIETANGQSELANGIKENNHKYYNFLELVHLIKMPLLLVIVMLKSMIGQHQVKQLWAVQLLFVINILKTNKLRFIK